MKYIAGRIREHRVLSGEKALSQEALAAAVGVSTNTVSRWETGIYRPSVSDLDKLARFFNVSILAFFPPDREPTLDASLVRLRRAVQGLKADDLRELERYAEFRRARHQLEQQGGTPRKRKSS